MLRFLFSWFSTKHVSVDIQLICGKSLGFKTELNGPMERTMVRATHLQRPLKSEALSGLATSQFVHQEPAALSPSLLHACLNPKALP